MLTQKQIHKASPPHPGLKEAFWRGQISHQCAVDGFSARPLVLRLALLLQLQASRFPPDMRLSDVFLRIGSIACLSPR